MNRIVAFASVLLCIAASTYAANEPRADRSSNPKTGEAHEGTSSSHETTPPSEGRALSPQNQSIEGLSASVTANGVTKVDLEGRFQHALVLRVAPDGSRSVECIDSAEHEAEMLKAATETSEAEDKDED